MSIPHFLFCPDLILGTDHPAYQKKHKDLNLVQETGLVYL